MLTPTDVHFWVGLLTQISRPDSVELELGSIVFDATAEEGRDLDITVRTTAKDGNVEDRKGTTSVFNARPR